MAKITNPSRCIREQRCYLWINLCGCVCVLLPILLEEFRIEVNWVLSSALLNTLLSICNIYSGVRPRILPRTIHHTADSPGAQHTVNAVLCKNVVGFSTTVVSALLTFMPIIYVLLLSVCLSWLLVLAACLSGHLFVLLSVQSTWPLSNVKYDNLFVNRRVYRSVSLPVCWSINWLFMPACMSTCLPICLSACLPACPSVVVYECLSPDP